MAGPKATVSGRRISPGSEPATSRRRWLWLVVAGVLATVVVARFGPRGGGDDTAGGDVGVVHVHGLGVNPKDNTLYAATHTGLFRIPADGKAMRVNGRWQDTMGFTRVRN